MLQNGGASATLSGPSSSNNLVSLGREFKRVIVEEGVFAFWKGNLASVLHRFPYSAINFSVYERTRTTFKALGYEENMPIRVLSGAMGGGVACAAAYPLDIVRTRLSVERERPLKRANNGYMFNSRIVEIIGNIIKDEGPRGLYRGLFVSMSVAVPNLAIGFGVYGTLKDYMLYSDPSGRFRRPGEAASEPTLNATGAMISGAIGGSFSSIVVFPLDVVRRRMQVVGLSGAAGRNVNAVSLVRDIWRKEGMSGLYGGIVPELLKVTPMVGITFAAYELTSAFLRGER